LNLMLPPILLGSKRGLQFRSCSSRNSDFAEDRVSLGELSRSGKGLFPSGPFPTCFLAVHPGGLCP
jgi:hypothetical protein